jgi:hypothetical protein
MSKIFLATIAIFFFLASCSIRLSPDSEQAAVSEIYTEIFRNDFSPDGKGIYCENIDLVVNSITDNRRFEKYDWQWASKTFPQLKQETMENFVQVNSQPIPFPNDLNFGCKYTLRDLEQNPRDWATESSLMIYSFSRIGFDSSKKQAFVSRFVSFAHSGYGVVYFLEMVDGHWNVTKAVKVFMVDYD